ncbi:unnamed protein product, partial [Arctogadus glacialis]
MLELGANTDFPKDYQTTSPNQEGHVLFRGGPVYVWGGWGEVLFRLESPNALFWGAGWALRPQESQGSCVRVGWDHVPVQEGLVLFLESQVMESQEGRVLFRGGPVYVWGGWGEVLFRLESPKALFWGAGWALRPQESQGSCVRVGWDHVPVQEGLVLFLESQVMESQEGLVLFLESQVMESQEGRVLFRGGPVWDHVPVQEGLVLFLESQVMESQEGRVLFRGGPVYVWGGWGEVLFRLESPKALFWGAGWALRPQESQGSWVRVGWDHVPVQEGLVLFLESQVMESQEGHVLFRGGPVYVWGGWGEVLFRLESPKALFWGAGWALRPQESQGSLVRVGWDHVPVQEGLVLFLESQVMESQEGHVLFRGGPVYVWGGWGEVLFRLESPKALFWGAGWALRPQESQGSLVRVGWDHVPVQEGLVLFLESQVMESQEGRVLFRGGPVYVWGGWGEVLFRLESPKALFWGAGWALRPQESQGSLVRVRWDHVPVQEGLVLFLESQVMESQEGHVLFRGGPVWDHVPVQEGLVLFLESQVMESQ